jgi:predicted  nucleic acid-binding Zn-ribbon protein
MEWSRIEELEKKIAKYEKAIAKKQQELENLEEILYNLKMELEEKENYKYLSDNDIEW